MPIWASQLSFRNLIAVAIGLIGTAALATGLTIWWLRAEALRDAFADSNNLAIVLAEQTTRSIQSIHLILGEIQERLDTLGVRARNDIDRLFGGEDIHQLLMERLSRLQQAEFIGLVDKNGRLVNSTQKWPSPEIDLSDRDHFQHLKNNADRGVLISNSQVERIKGTQVVFFSKRINGANNTFLGLIAVGVRITYFKHIYESISSQHDQSILILQSDGTVIVRYPDSNDRAGEKMPAESSWYRLVSQGGGHYRSPSYFDGTAHLVAVRPLSDYPLVVNVAVSEMAALATWRNHTIYIGFGTLLTLLCSVFLLKALSNQFHCLMDSQASLAEGKAILVKKAQELKSANAQITNAQALTNAAMNNMSQGLIMFDSSARLVVCNQRYTKMYGLSPELVKPGCTLRELLDHSVAIGTSCSDDPEQYLGDLQADLGQGQIANKITALHDGRIISIVNHPMKGGGWVATHEDITERKRTEEQIIYAAHHDALTGLANRKLFYELLEQALKRVQRGEQLAVLYLDLDHLKRINDTLGHPIGDKLLKAVADRLRGCVRDIDTISRLSGDEFAIIQSLLDQPSEAAALATRIGDAIKEPYDLDGHQVVVSVTVGISIAPNDATELNELLKTADMALYEAKNTGRGTYCYYEPEMTVRMQARGRLEQDLRSALANGEYDLFYQPIANLQNDKICTFEALLRWHHPERGMISPTEFIPVAEEMGLIVPLGEWILRTACAEAATWPSDIKVAVNVSPVQLKSKNLINVIISAIASAGIPASRLQLEITESVFMQNTFANVSTLKKLRELGVQFAMDDFGTGYSSLGNLLRFPFDKIKIDRSFITSLSDKKEHRAIVRAVTELARNLGMTITAEGIETQQQLQEVRILGCTEMQGYLLSPPRPAAEILQFFPPRGESIGGSMAVNARAGRKT